MRITCQRIDSGVSTRCERIQLTIQPFVDVHKTVQEVLPGIENKDSDEELHARGDDMVDGLGEHHFPCDKSGLSSVRGEGVVSSGNGTSQHWMRIGEVLGDGGGVEAEGSEENGQGALGETDAGGPDGDVVLSLARHLGRLGQRQDSAGGDLDDLLHNDIASDLVARGTIALSDFFRSVEAILREEVVDVNEVEGQGEDPVDDDGDDEGEPEVGDPGKKVGLRLKCV